MPPHTKNFAFRKLSKDIIFRAIVVSVLLILTGRILFSGYDYNGSVARYTLILDAIGLMTAFLMTVVLCALVFKANKEKTIVFDQSRTNNATYKVWYADILNRKPEWISAISTMLQTIAVIATLIVAYREWVNHETAAEQSKIDNVLKMYAEESEQVTTARYYIDQVNSAFACIDLKDSFKDTSALKDIQISCDAQAMIKKVADDFILKVRPMQDKFTKIETCIEAKLCDANVSARLFCGDVNLMTMAFRRWVFGWKFGEYTQKFIDRCGKT